MVLDHRYGAGNGSQGSLTIMERGVGSRRKAMEISCQRTPSHRVTAEVIWLSEDPRGHSGRTTVNG